MPIYEYRCGSCGHRFEKLQKVADPRVKKCPVCGHSKVRRLLSQSAFVLKGKGWYVTDYPSKDRKRALEAEKGEGVKVGGEDSSGERKGKAEKKESTEVKGST